MIKYIEGTRHEDLTGMRFNKLLVLSVSHIKNFSNKNNKTRVYYNCICDCGNNAIISAPSLRGNHSKSCGCLKLRTSELKKKVNRYEFYEDYIVGYDCNDKSFMIDIEDYDKIKDFFWVCSPFGYFSCCRTIDGKKINFKLHRVIMGCTKHDNICIDHINTLNKFDNRKSNLRVATRQENMFNSKLSKNSKSGFTGVYWSNKDKSWYSQINYNRKHIHLGYTKTKEDAIIQRLKAEIEYFGKDFAPQRHLFEEYGIIT